LNGLGSTAASPTMKSASRLLEILQLFSTKRTNLTVADVARELKVSASTIYRYFSILAEFGWIQPESESTYALGWAALKTDLLARVSDPVLAGSPSVVPALLSELPDNLAVMICRDFDGNILCTSISSKGAFPFIHDLQRGETLPLLYGAPSKVILAHKS